MVQSDLKQIKTRKKAGYSMERDEYEESVNGILILNLH